MVQIFYPYRSRLRTRLKGRRQGQDYVLWEHGLKERIAKAGAPVIEIGGPTEDGYYFLDDVPLPEKPIITNISGNPLPFAPNAKELAGQVQQIVDGRDMPFANRSVGIFLMSAMSISSDWWVGLSDEDKDKAEPKFEDEYRKARLETGQVAAGLLRPQDAKHAQRVQIYGEVHRTLRKGGLFFTNGTTEELLILQKMGFQLIALLQYLEDSNITGTACEFVVAKP